MKKILLLFTLFPLMNFAQQVVLITPTSDTILESSGLIFMNGKLITHNDSGGEAALFEVDTINGTILRKVHIKNTGNTDWEDICYDDNYIYIGDFGNNSGNRTNLRVFRLSISDYLTMDTLSADTIRFSYAEQTNFTATSYSTNFDAEAMISLGDSLYIFTKNWGDKKSIIYALPKNPGNYSISKFDSINPQGLITGATYNNYDNTVLLTGYTSPTTFTFNPFIVKIDGFSGNQFSQGNLTKTIMTGQMSYQIEGITESAEGKYFITSENSQFGSANLYSLTYINSQTTHLNLLKDKNNIPVIYPNPSSEYIELKNITFDHAIIYDSQGKQILSSNNQKIDIASLRKGNYFLNIYHNKKMIDVLKFIVE